MLLTSSTMTASIPGESRNATTNEKISSAWETINESENFMCDFPGYVDQHGLRLPVTLDRNYRDYSDSMQIVESKASQLNNAYLDLIEYDPANSSKRIELFKRIPINFGRGFL